ncbi:MAG: hypothetical protein FWF82_01560, partial [Oscillospiraceae bacterium]|nr:hypothetical protein [Oscillospiraceae bacterium]
MKIIISYLLILILITLYALFLDAVSGFFVLAIFIGAIYISSMLHLLAMNFFNCTLSVKSKLFEKGENIELTVTVPKAPFYIPTVFEINFALSYHLTCEEDSFTVTLGRRAKEQTFVLKPRFWGKATIGIASIKAIDILGFHTAVPTLKKLRDTGEIVMKNKIDVKIFPKIP